ncbi:MAG: O-antigen ligase family protein [Candidatus Geothermincolia bacterium]
MNSFTDRRRVETEADSPDLPLAVGPAVAAGSAIVALALAGVLLPFVPLQLLFFTSAGVILFLVINRNMQIGLVIFLALNAVLPQAGPSLGGNLQVGLAGEARGLHFNMHEIVMSLVLLAWLAGILTGKRRIATRSPLILPVLILAVFSIVASFTGMMHGATGMSTVFRFMRTTVYIYIFFLVLNNVRTERDARRLIFVFLGCASVVAFIGLAQRALGESWAQQFSRDFLETIGYPAAVNVIQIGSQEQVYRISSTFIHPNILGGYLVFALPFFGSMIRVARYGWSKALLVAGLFLNVGCLFYTGSRAAWLGVAAILFFYILLGLRERRFILMLVNVAVIILLIVFLVNPPGFIQERLSASSASEAASLRLQQYELAVDMFMEHPFLGMGVGLEGKQLMVGSIRTEWGAVESVYLTLLATTGALGLLAFLLVLGFFWAGTARGRRRAPTPFLAAACEGFTAAMIGLATASLFGAWLITASAMVSFFWFMIGMGAVVARLAVTGEAAVTSTSPAARRTFLP